MTSEKIAPPFVIQKKRSAADRSSAFNFGVLTGRVSGEDRRAHARAWVDGALKHGVAFGLQADGSVWIYRPAPDGDQEPSGYLDATAEALEYNRRVIREELRRRIKQNGEEVALPHLGQA